MCLLQIRTFCQAFDTWPALALARSLSLVADFEITTKQVHTILLYMSLCWYDAETGEWLQVATNQCATLVNFLQSSVLGPKFRFQPITLHSSREVPQVDLCIAAFAHCAPLKPKIMTWDSKSPFGGSMPVNDPLPCNQANTTTHWHILYKVCMCL